MPAPSNDNFANAEVISGASGTSGPWTIDAATTEASEPSGSDLALPPTKQTVWFKWTAPGNGSVKFDTYGSLAGDSGSGDGWAGVGAFGHLDTNLTVWTGVSLGTLVEVASNEDDTFNTADNGFSSALEFTASSSTDYYIQVGTFNSPFLGTVLLHWVAAVPLIGVGIAFGNNALDANPSWTRLDA